MNRAALTLLAALFITGCSSNSFRADKPVRGNLASEPISSPEPMKYPSGGEGALARAGNIYIAGQPTEESLRNLIATENITAVINLRTDSEMNNRERLPFDEAALLSSLNIPYIHVPIGLPDHPATTDTTDKVAQALANHNGPVLLHCGSGARASNVWAAYLVRHRGYTPEKAIEEAAKVQPNRPMFANLIDADIKYIPKTKQTKN